MTAQIKKIAAYTISIALGLFLLYLALRGVDFEEFKAALQNATYWWALPIMIVTLFSHALRALRWQILLEALPDRHRKGELRSVSFKTAFLSLLIGYFANLFTIKIGEVARSVSLSRKEGLRFSGVFGTVVIERVFDVMVLALGIASLSFLFYEQFLFLQQRILSPILSSDLSNSIGWMILGMSGAGMVCYIAYRSIKTSQSTRSTQLRRRFVSFLNSFKDGMLTLLRSPRRASLIGLTVLMWSIYAFMAYLTFVMLGMHESFNLGASAAWSIMIFGAIGFAIPSPGGTGSFHYFAKLALVNLYFVDEATAIAYAVLSHGLHVVIYIFTGVLALFIQGTNLKALQSTTIDTD